jgi:hypothetical protein
MSGRKAGDGIQGSGPPDGVNEEIPMCKLPLRELSQKRTKRTLLIVLLLATLAFASVLLAAECSALVARGVSPIIRSAS